MQNAAADALSVAATAEDGGSLTYQWYSNTEKSMNGATPIAGGTNAACTPSTAKTGTMYYYVVVTNTNNAVDGTRTASTTSNIATIAVNPQTGPSGPSGPSSPGKTEEAEEIEQTEVPHAEVHSP